MLKSRGVKPLAVLIFSLGIAALPGSCSSKTYIGGKCGEDADCHTDFNFWGYGTLCTSGRCTCPNPEEAPCCPNGAESCKFGYFDCRSASECATCESDAECPGPPDPRCGAGVCREGKCALEIAGGLRRLRRTRLPSLLCRRAVLGRKRLHIRRVRRRGMPRIPAR
jgi:hypothetical protein